MNQPRDPNAMRGAVVAFVAAVVWALAAGVQLVGHIGNSWLSLVDTVVFFFVGLRLLRRAKRAKRLVDGPTQRAGGPLPRRAPGMAPPGPTKASPPPVD
jgi:uncharacterized membrane protein YfcA